MSKVVIIIDKEGKLESVYADDELSVKVLQKGIDPNVDTKIDALDQQMEQIEL